MRRQIPLVILGGADSRPARLPDGSEDRHALSGCKGVDVRLGGRCLIEVVRERLQESGAFEPIWIAGPESAYRDAGVEGHIIDTNGSFGDNIRAGTEAAVAEYGDGAMAIATCDILPGVDELRKLLDHYHLVAPCDLWFPVVRADAEGPLGASDWKPRYRVAPTPGEEPVSLLPGHLTIFDPSAMRLDLVYRLFGLAYSSRNRPIRYRRSYMMRGLIGELLRQDVLHVLGLRLPTLTWDVAANGVVLANRLRLGVLTLAQLEDALRRAMVKRRHRRAHPERRVLVPITTTMSLARDIDTVEEARAVGAEATTTGGGG